MSKADRWARFVTPFQDWGKYAGVRSPDLQPGLSHRGLSARRALRRGSDKPAGAPGHLPLRGLTARGFERAEGPSCHSPGWRPG